MNEEEIYELGKRHERERIIAAINDAPTSFDFFGHYVPRDKVIAVIKGETS